MNNLSFVTLTNDGYLDYTENCIKSLERCKFDFSSIQNKKVKIYSIGDKAKKLEKIFPGKVDVEELKSCNVKEFANFKESSSYATIVQKKFEVITREFENSEFVCFFDGDIVFEHQNFLKCAFDGFLKNPNQEIIMQDDTEEKPKSPFVACSGFMIIKRTENMKRMFHPDMTIKYEKNKDWGDQDYINEKILPIVKYSILSRTLFPNGCCYYNRYKFINPMIIHFNWIIGKEKKKKMEKHNKWYLL